MDWLNLVFSWLFLLLQWAASIPSFTSTFGAHFLEWLAGALAAGNGGHPPQPTGGVSPSATPELDSLVLFGTGLLGAGGYALTRFRACRRSS